MVGDPRLGTAGCGMGVQVDKNGLGRGRDGKGRLEVISAPS